MAGNQEPVERIAKLLDDIAFPKKNERMLIMADYPEGKPCADDAERQILARQWHSAASCLSSKKGFNLLPLVLYRQTGKNNAELPKKASTAGGGHVDDLPSLIASCNIAIAITKYSASAPLKNIVASSGSLRAISMPGVNFSMQEAMHADYSSIRARAQKLLPILQSAASLEFLFDGAGIPRKTSLRIDTRGAAWAIDAGICRSSGDFINFPSGEIFAPPYEGATESGRLILGESQTQGVWPIYSHDDGKVTFLKVEKNRIVRVQGDSAEAEKIIRDIADDENAANIAEVGLGLNEKARSGPGVPVLESEKAGPHIAYGRNDHFGSPHSLTGKVKASVHVDYVYASQSPITATVFAVFKNGQSVLIAQRGKIVAV
ncbi:MAG: hypothetical protein N3F07_02505 [Candidatus Micrarchaeota archaeon]|nr:hypothetical protein [Candidatus Micrarchaeota archaeon]